MPRPRRLNLNGIPIHITQRANNRQACFFLKEDRLTYLKLMGRAARRRDCGIHAYVLMANHVHILATPLEADGISDLCRTSAVNMSVTSTAATPVMPLARTKN